MVTFVTFFLGLVTGLRPVEVAVDGPAARVEIVLDQRVVRTLTRPPWRTRCDFGPDILPHELEAIAYDDQGAELGRARELVNLPRAQAEVRIVLASDERGLPAAARVVWDVAEPIQPLGVFVIFDGQVLPSAVDESFPLPDYDPDKVHIVSAEARFPDGVTARADVTFGGRYGSSIVTELTAVPIEVADRRPAPALPDLHGVFRAHDATLTPAAVERPGIRIFLVRDHAATINLDRIKRRQDLMREGPPLTERAVAALRLTRENDALHFVTANPIQRRDRELYPTSPALDLDRWSLRWLVTHLSNRDSPVAGQRLGEATAVAGVQAAAEAAPRAVLLVLSEDPRDSGGYDPQTVRRYLQAVRVPFAVWTAGERAASGWDPVQVVSTSTELRDAARQLLDQLDRQWVVWLEGSHLINQVELTTEGSARGFRLPGS
jgi:hypothetical protein